MERGLFLEFLQRQQLGSWSFVIVGVSWRNLPLRPLHLRPEIDVVFLYGQANGG